MRPGAFLTACLLMSWWSPAAPLLVFPHLVEGAGVESHIVLINPAAVEDRGEVAFLDSSGQPLELNVDGTPLSMLRFRIPPQGFQQIGISGQDILRSGYAVLRSDLAESLLAATVRIRVGAAEVFLLDSPPAREQRLFVEDSESVRTGLSFVNLSEENALVRCELLDARGRLQAENSLTLQAGERRARFADELFPDQERPYRGILRVGSSRPLSLTAIRQSETGLGGVAVTRGREEVRMPGPDLFDGQLALSHVEDQTARGARPTGSAALLEAGNTIEDRLRRLGWSVEQDLHTLDFGSLRVPVRNLVARRGEGPVVILAAHYDTRIHADRDRDPERRLDPVPGANDGGSGVAVLLELARVISDHYLVNREIRLLFFDAEDNGDISPWNELPQSLSRGWVIGSSLYADNLGPEQIEFMILVDMVGDRDQRFLQEAYSRTSAPLLLESIWSVAAALGFGDVFVSQNQGAILDDHVPFLERGIPAVDLIDLDYVYWHTTEDTLDKVSAESLERVGLVLQTFLVGQGILVRGTD